jgi:CHAT domain-containing protein
MPSLARAFLASGAQAVVATLWDVDDDASGQLFRRFHLQLRTARSARRALAMTQRAFIQRHDDRSHPIFWSAVEVFGEK